MNGHGFTAVRADGHHWGRGRDATRQEDRVRRLQIMLLRLVPRLRDTAALRVLGSCRTATSRGNSKHHPAGRDASIKHLGRLQQTGEVIVGHVRLAITLKMYL